MYINKYQLIHEDLSLYIEGQSGTIVSKIRNMLDNEYAIFVGDYEVMIEVYDSNACECVVHGLIAFICCWKLY